VRIRITSPPSGTIDGIRLDRFFLGATYDVGTTLANYLLAIGCAEIVEADVPALVLPIDHPIAERIGHRAPAMAADKAPPRNRRRE